MTYTIGVSNQIQRTVNCVECGTEFQTTHSQGRYCSDSCRQIGNRRSWNKYSMANRDARRKYGKSWYELNKVKRTKQIKQYLNSPAGKEVTRKAGINSRKNNPEKYKARLEVLMAKRKGILVPEPCCVCGVSPTEAHHIDYGAPLDVMWLCTQHHKELHRNNKHGIFVENVEVIE